MSVFFNGRLIVTPAVASQINDQALSNTNPNVGNKAVLIGRSVGGQPNTPLTFQSPEDAAATLISGDLLDGIRAAFDPSGETAGPSQVVVIRVNPATQSSLALLDSGGNTAINLQSSGYGAYTTQDNIKVEAGTVSGLKVTAKLGGNYYVGDNLGRSPFTVNYTGANASASMTIAGSSITLASPTGTTVKTIDLTQFPTVQQVVDVINTVTGFTAAVTGGYGGTAALLGLDFVTAQDVKTTTFAVQANLQAVIDWINSPAEPLLVATRGSTAGLPPVTIGQTYLSGGSDGTVTNTNWSNALTVLQTVSDIYWVCALTSDASIHAMVDTHCNFMSNVAGKERRQIAGMACGTTDLQAEAEALSLNSPRTGLVHLGVYLDNAAGALTLYPGYITAALLAGMFSGVNPGTALTNKTIKVQGIERKVRNPADTDALITGGVLAIEYTPTGYRVVRSNSTWLGDTKFNKVEFSVGWAADFAVRSVREALQSYIGQKGTYLTVRQALETVKTVLGIMAQPEPQGLAVLAGDAANPAYKNLRGSLTGDVLAVSFDCSPVIPVNYIPVTVSLTPYSTTLTL